MKILAKTANMTRVDWVRTRVNYLGGSEISCLAGINPYKSKYELWLEKTGQVEIKEMQSEVAHIGSQLESYIKKLFTEQTGLKVRAKNMILQHDEYHFLCANLDGVIFDGKEHCVFEAKNVSQFKADQWVDGIPEIYMLQVQYYLLITGFNKAYVAALIGGNHLVYHVVTRDENKIQEILTMAKNFWFVNVQQMIEPEADGSEATTRFLNERYDESNGETVQLPEEALTILSRYDKVSSRLDELNRVKNSLSNQLKVYMEDNEYGVVGDRKVSWKTIYKHDLDKKRLKEEQPDLYKEYTSQSSYRRLLVA